MSELDTVLYEQRALALRRDYKTGQHPLCPIDCRDDCRVCPGWQRGMFDLVMEEVLLRIGTGRGTE